jgi:HEPN domain-containing protein
LGEESLKNKDLVQDYLTRAAHRLAAVELLYERESYADVMRESQELVELCLKALLRASHLEVPRTHDVSDILLKSKAKLPKKIQTHAKELAKISRYLRRDRELSFYGSEDLTPSSFYREEDAKEALNQARWVYETCRFLNPEK